MTTPIHSATFYGYSFEVICLEIMYKQLGIEGVAALYASKVKYSLPDKCCWMPPSGSDKLLIFFRNFYLIVGNSTHLIISLIFESYMLIIGEH